jgi:biopolymer transport protein ExbD
MRFRRRLSPNANVDLVPMIDVVFQLVIFFMLTSTFVMTPGIAIDLPESSSSEAVVINRLVVTVVSSREIYINQQPVTLETMQAALDAVAPEDDDQPLSVIIEGDSTVPYQTMVQILDVLRRNGYRGVALRTIEEDR